MSLTDEIGNPHVRSAMKSLKRAFCQAAAGLDKVKDVLRMGQHAVSHLSGTFDHLNDTMDHLIRYSEQGATEHEVVDGRYVMEQGDCP